jgi:hypothetical protein
MGQLFNIDFTQSVAVAAVGAAPAAGVPSPDPPMSALQRAYLAASARGGAPAASASSSHAPASSAQPAAAAAAATSSGPASAAASSGSTPSMNFTGRTLRVPGRGDCAFLAVITGLLGPVVGDENQFDLRMKRVTLSFLHFALPEGVQEYMRGQNSEQSWWLLAPPLSRLDQKYHPAAVYLDDLVTYLRQMLAAYRRHCEEFHVHIKEEEREVYFAKLAESGQYLNCEDLEVLGSLMGLQLHIEGILFEPSQPLGRWTRAPNQAGPVRNHRGWPARRLLKVTIRFVNFLTNQHEPPTSVNPSNHFVGVIPTS